MELFLLLCNIALAAFLWLMVKNWKDPLRRVPGPRGIPLLGNVLTLDPAAMHMTLYNYALKYGPVYILHMFTKPFIVINSGEACIEALSRHGSDFDGRTPALRWRYIVKEDLALTDYSNPIYHVLRKVASKSLRVFGGGAKLERVLQENLQDIVDVIHKLEGKPIDTHRLSYGFTCTVITSLIFGEKYLFDDPICQSIHTMNEELIKGFNPNDIAAITDIYPWLFNLRFLFRDCFTQLDRTRELHHEHVLNRVIDAKATFNKDALRGCLDYFIQAQMEELDECGKPLIDDNSLIGMLSNFIVGGIETSLASLSQAFIDFLHDPDLQTRIQAELDAQFDRNHCFSMSDREKLPLLEAYVLENLRILTQVPLLLPHRTLRDTEVAGYKIPANTGVIINSFFAAHDPEIYEDPFECKPERFLDNNGKVRDVNDPIRRNFVGFGLGRRQCIGEHLARSRIFLFLATILRKFRIEKTGDELPSRDVRTYKMSVVISSLPVNAVFRER